MSGIMLHRVARAIAEVVDRRTTGDYDIDGEIAEECATAAIEAIREPTPEMVRVGVDDILTGPGMSAYASWPDLVADRHRKMISAALSQSPSLPSEDR